MSYFLKTCCMTNYRTIAEACNLGAISGIPAHIKQEFYNILLYYSLELHTFAQNTKSLFSSASSEFSQLGMASIFTHILEV